MFEKLKKRWGIKNNFQLLIILIVFTVTGSATVYFKRPVFDFIGISTATILLIKIPVYIVVVIPMYYILLLCFGLIFGQYLFFRNFLRKSIGRFIFRKKKQAIKNY